MKMKKLFTICLLLVLTGMVLMLGCDPDPETEPSPETGEGIDWEDHSSGTLTVSNNTSKDMVVFQGQTPTPSTILGGVRGLATKTFDISLAVSDFEVGGYMILRGMTLDEYEANKANLFLAKIEYSAMATYGQGKKFRTEINPEFMGEYGYKVTNTGKVGMELRKDSPDGKKIAYLPSSITNMTLYANTADALAIYPVYMFYNKRTGQVTAIKPINQYETAVVYPRPITGSSVQTYYFPANQTDIWETIVASMEYPIAFVTVINKVPQQAVSFSLAEGNVLTSQDGYSAVSANEQLTFEIASTGTGTEKGLVVSLYGGAVTVPVRFNGAATNPIIKNGYDYTVTVNFNGGDAQDAASYSAVLIESTEPHDISEDIVSL